MKLIYCGLLLLCPYMSRAQQPANIAPVPLSIGDKLPDIVFSKMMNYSSSSLNTKDIKAKLILLDFWATWCSACLTKFDLLDSVRKAYKGEVEIILVNSVGTNDDEGRINKLLARLHNKRGSALQLPIVIGDVAAKQYFPHRAIPHYAWLDENKRLLAVTGAEAVTLQNIEMAIAGRAPVAAQKIDRLDFDISRSFFVNDSNSISQLLYGSNLLPEMTGLGSSSWMERRNDSLVSQRRYTNNSLLGLLMNAHNSYIIPNKIVYDKAITNDSVYCYELMTPLIPIAQSNQWMQLHLERYFGVRAKMEKRLREVYLLTIDSLLLKNYNSKGGKSVNALNEVGSRYMINKPLKALTGFLDFRMDKPVICETTFSGLLDINLSTENFSYQNLASILSPMGISLTKTQRQVGCFVIY